eukprot:gb/GECG01010559.1/.p1 GENE.gb/GECG01010559.1/~~gb/GECG01010559.1/.p1  ORF type:complete len:1970 (+),score=290.76 gb/GECG01010559.1/:1-5910(+)
MASSQSSLPALKTSITQQDKYHDTRRSSGEGDAVSGQRQRRASFEAQRGLVHDPSERRHSLKGTSPSAEDQYERSAVVSSGVQGVADLLKKYPLNTASPEVYANTFHYLWTKDALHRNPAGVRIPHTVIYRHRQAYSWFFTSKDGSIKRKNKQNIHNTTIEQTFLKAKNEECDIVAKFVDLSSSRSQQQQAGDNEEACQLVEYFTASGLRDFLFSRRKPISGVLQTFIAPKGIYSSTIRVMWTPRIGHVERRVNVNKLSDTRLSPHERCATYDGESHLSCVVQVKGNRLPEQCKGICDNVAQHIQNVSAERFKVTGIIADMRIDSRGTLWFLAVSSLRVEGTGSVEGLTAKENQFAADGKLFSSLTKSQSRDEYSLSATLDKADNTKVVEKGSETSRKDSSGGELQAYHDVEQGMTETKTIAMYKYIARCVRGEPGSAANSVLKNLPSEPLPGDKHGMAKLKPSQCPSCGAPLDPHVQASTHTVAYKTIAVHYDQLLKRLRLKPYPLVYHEEQNALSQDLPQVEEANRWPTMEEALRAAGGVGAFAVYTITIEEVEEVKKKKYMHPQYTPPRHLVRPVPPVIHLMEPNLGGNEYRSRRKDIEWLFKPVHVCESCFLIFSKIASELIAGATPHHAVDAILGPREAPVVSQPVSKKERIRTEMEHVRSQRIQRNAELSRLKQALQRGLANKTRRDAEILVAKSRKLDDKVKELEETPYFEWTPELAKTALSVLRRSASNQEGETGNGDTNTSFIKYPFCESSPDTYGVPPPADHEAHPLHHLLFMQFALAKFDDDARNGFIVGQKKTRKELLDQCRTMEGNKDKALTNGDEFNVGAVSSSHGTSTGNEHKGVDEGTLATSEHAEWDTRQGPGTMMYVPEYINKKLNTTQEYDGDASHEKPDPAFPSKSPQKESFKALEKKEKKRKGKSAYNSKTGPTASSSKGTSFVPAPPIMTAAYRRQTRTARSSQQTAKTADSGKGAKRFSSLFAFTNSQVPSDYQDTETRTRDAWNVVADQWQSMLENTSLSGVEAGEEQGSGDDSRAVSPSVSGRRRRRHRDERKQFRFQNKASVDAYIEAEALRKQALEEVRQDRLKEHENIEAEEAAREAARQARRDAREEKLKQEVTGSVRVEHDRKGKAQEVNEALEEADEALQNAKYRADIHVGPGYTRAVGVGSSVKLAERKRKERIQRSRQGSSLRNRDSSAAHPANVPVPPMGSGILTCGFKVDGKTYPVERMDEDTVSELLEPGGTQHRAEFVVLRKCPLGEYQPNIDEQNACERSLVWLQQFGAGSGGSNGDDPNSRAGFAESESKSDGPLLADIRNIRDVEVGWGRGMYSMESLNLRTGEVTRRYLSRWDFEDAAVEDDLVSNGNQCMQRWRDLLKSYGIDPEAVDSLIRRLPPAPGRKQERVLLPPANPSKGWGSYHHRLEAEEWKKLLRNSRCMWNDDEVYRIKVEKVNRSISILQSYKASIDSGKALSSKKDSADRNEVCIEDVDFSKKLLHLDESNSILGTRPPPRAIEDGHPPPPLKEVSTDTHFSGTWFTDVSSALGYKPAIPNTMQGVIAWGLYRGIPPPHIYMVWIRGHPHCHPYKGKPFTVFTYSFMEGTSTIQRYKYAEILSHPAVRSSSRLRVVVRNFCSKIVLNLPVEEHQPQRHNISQPFTAAITEMFSPDTPPTKHPKYQFRKGLLANMLSVENDGTGDIRYYCLEATDARRPVISIRRHDVGVSSVDKYALRRDEIESPSSNPFIWQSAKTLELSFRSKEVPEILLACKIHLLEDNWYLLALSMIPPANVKASGFQSDKEALEDPHPEEVKRDRSRSADPRSQSESAETGEYMKSLPRYRLVVVCLDTYGAWERYGYNPYPGDADGGDAGNEELLNVREKVFSFLEARNTEVNPLLEHAQSIETEKDISQQLRQHLRKLVEGDQEHLNEEALQHEMEKSDTQFMRELGYRQDQASLRRGEERSASGDGTT